MNSPKSLVTVCLWVFILTGNTVVAKRKGVRRSTEEIAIGLSILGAFLIAVAVSVLYCRFCTKRKRYERKRTATIISTEILGDTAKTTINRVKTTAKPAEITDKGAKTTATTSETTETTAESTDKSLETTNKTVSRTAVEIIIPKINISPPLTLTEVGEPELNSDQSGSGQCDVSPTTETTTVVLN